MKFLRYVFFLIIAFLFAYLFLVSTAHASAISREIVFQEVNQERIESNLPPLKLSVDLTKAAQLKADDMVKVGYFAHRSPQGKNVWNFVRAVKLLPEVAGENLARGFSTSESTVLAWMNSPTHRSNILYPTYSEAGIGVATKREKGKDVTYVVQVFAQF